MESTKNADIRVNNRKRVVNTLFRRGAMTKQELAQRLDLSLPTVTLLLKELKQKGLIENGETLDSTGGRKPVCLMPVYDIKYAVGVEVSLHELRIVALDLGNHIIAKETLPYGFDITREYWELVSAEVERFIGQNIEDCSRVLHVGITLQIPMDRTSDIWRGRFRGEEKCLDSRMMRSCFSREVIVHDSAKMAAIAQIWSAEHVPDDFVYVSVGSCISGALVRERLVVDINGMNAQFGSIIPGNAAGGRLEDYCIADALCEKSSSANVEEFFRRLDEGDGLCEKIWSETLDILSVFLYNMYCIFGWEIVVGGSLSSYLEKYQGEISRRLAALEEDDSGASSCVTVSDLGAYSSAMGAAMLAIDRFLDDGYSAL